MSTRLPTFTSRFPNPPARAAARARVCHTHTHPSANPDVALAGALVIRRTRMPPPAHPPERVCGQLPSALGRSRTRRRAVSLRRPPRGHGAGVPLYPPAHPLANPYRCLLVHQPQPPPPASAAVHSCTHLLRQSPCLPAPVPTRHPARPAAFPRACPLTAIDVAHQAGRLCDEEETTAHAPAHRCVHIVHAESGPQAALIWYAPRRAAA